MLAKILKPLLKIQKQLQKYHTDCLNEEDSTKEVVAKCETRIKELQTEQTSTMEVLKNINNLLGVSK